MLSPELFILSFLYTLLSATVLTTDTPWQLVLTPDDDCVFTYSTTPASKYI